MHIQVKWFNDNFNVELCSKEGAEAFLSIKGVRMVHGNQGTFISYPARKKEDGNWWKHFWANDAFNAAVMEKANAAKPQSEPTPAQADAPGDFDDDSDIPF